MGMTVSELVSDVGGLITLPDVYLRINRLVEDPNSTNAQLVEVVGRDPSFSVRLLQAANSPLYRRGATVDSIAKAVSIIGTAHIRSLALSMSVASSFEGLPNKLVSMENFWSHSLLCALAARLLAQEARRCDPDVVFTAGLLHDIGELVMFNRMPQEATEALLLVEDSIDEMPIYLAERQVMGFDHAEVGGEIARLWHLPPILEECIRYHHDLQSARSFPRETALVHIANIVAQMAELDTLDPADVPPINPFAWETTGLDDSLCEEVVRAIQTEFGEVRNLFFGKESG